MSDFCIDDTRYSGEYMLNEKEEIELLKLLEIENEQLNKVKIKQNAEYFIETYVKIENQDNVEEGSELAVPFLLWKEQKKALQDFLSERLNIVLKARQLGLTWLALAFAVWNIINKPGYRVVALSKTETPDAKELIRRVEFILTNLPEWMIREDTKENLLWNGLKWSSTALTITIIHPSSDPALFISMSASPDSGRSFTANLVILDEWAFQEWARKIWSAAYPTINRPTGGKVIGLSSAKRMTLFEDIWKKAKSGMNTFNTIFLSWRTDPRRDDKWYEQTKKDLPQSYKAEYPNTPEEAFEAAEGVAFPEYSYDIHVIKPFKIPGHWFKWRSVDNGYTDPFAWYWYAVNEQGTVFFFREFTREEDEPKLIYTDQAKKVAELTKEDDSYTVAGHDAWSTHHRDSSNKTLINYYEDGGVYNFYRAETDRKLRKSTWHQYLKPYYDDVSKQWTAKVQIFAPDDSFPDYGCPKLIETLPQLICDPKDNEKVAECKIDHWYDSGGYGLISYHVKTSDMQTYNTDDDEDEDDKPKGSSFFD